MECEGAGGVLRGARASRNRTTGAAVRGDGEKKTAVVSMRSGPVGTVGGGEHDGCMGRGATRCGVGSRSANGVSLGGQVFPPNVAPGARQGGPGRATARFGENGAGGKRRRATERHGGMGRGATGWGQPLGAQCFLGGQVLMQKKHQRSLTKNGEGYRRDLFGYLHGQIAHGGTR